MVWLGSPQGAAQSSECVRQGSYFSFKFFVDAAGGRERTYGAMPPREVFGEPKSIML
jgi:hypothetical protein